MAACDFQPPADWLVPALIRRSRTAASLCSAHAPPDPAADSARYSPRADLPLELTLCAEQASDAFPPDSALSESPASRLVSPFSAPTRTGARPGLSGRFVHARNPVRAAGKRANSRRDRQHGKPTSDKPRRERVPKRSSASANGAKATDGLQECRRNAQPQADGADQMSAEYI